jgi:hypothetical protein
MPVCSRRKQSIHCLFVQDEVRISSTEYLKIPHYFEYFINRIREKILYQVFLKCFEVYIIYYGI